MRRSCAWCAAVPIGTCRSCRHGYCAQHGSTHGCDACVGTRPVGPPNSPASPCFVCGVTSVHACSACDRPFCLAHGRTEPRGPSDPAGVPAAGWSVRCNACRQLAAEDARLRRLLPARFVAAVQAAGSPGAERYPMHRTGALTTCWRIGTDFAADDAVPLYLTEQLDLCRLRRREQRGLLGRTRVVVSLKPHLRHDGDTIDDLLRTAADLGVDLELVLADG